MKYVIIVGLFMLVVGGLVYVQGGKKGEEGKRGARTLVTPPRTAGSVQALPDVTLRDYDGEEVRLGDYQGTPLVINAWAAWCPFCKKELADFAAVQQETGEQVRFIAIDRAESRAIAKGFSDQYALTDKLLFLLDPDDAFYQAIGGFSMPETLFVDRSGVIRYHKRGPMNVDEIRKRTKELIEKSK